jgi:transposase-like protein
MMPDPHAMTFKCAQALSSDSSVIITHLQQHGVLHKSINCKKCGQKMMMGVHSRRVDGYSWVCTSCKCRKSIRTASYFEKSMLPLSTIFMVLYCYLKFDKMLQRDIADICDVSETTLVNWANFIRETISHHYLLNPQVLGGANSVQIDESLFGGRRKYNRGDHQIHTHGWVFGMVEEKTNRNVLWLVDDRKKSTLMTLIRAHVLTGTTIKSDEWKSYATLDAEGYRHLTVNHSVQFVAEDGTHTQLIESHWAHVKSTLKLKHGTCTKHIPGYLDLYSFKNDAQYNGLGRLEYFYTLIQVGNCL